ncbi:MAG: hypothetical protein IPK07_15185 [Deltaproteobacteria bacterium]|nr:hypothetical protein [Deltaproteobacteria bacterium]
MRARTVRGLAVAAAVAAVVLFYIHGMRPWLAAHQLSFRLTPQALGALKTALGLVALALSIGEWLRRRRGRALPRRVVSVAFAVLAGCGGFAFLSSDDLAPDRYEHGWELFHYYLGSKYHDELGYKRIYRCAAVAQAELSSTMREEVKARKLRDLDTGLLVPAATALADPALCKDHFTPERWDAFVRDIHFFRSTSSRSYWNSFQTDHGYNPSPLWTTIASLVSSRVGASLPGMHLLASIDLVLYVALFFAVWWAFGARVLCVALIFFGCQFPANGFFTGGAFLRQDWLFAVVVSACLARRRKLVAAGFLLVLAAMLRVFPAILAAGWGVWAVRDFVRASRAGRPWRERVSPATLRLAAGGLAGVIVLGGASVAVAGRSSYGEFTRHIAVHSRTPLTNNMGLGTVFSYALDGRAQRTWNKALPDTWAVWAAKQRQHLAERGVARGMVITGLAAAFVAAVWTTRRAHVALALGPLAVTSLTTPTCYYYSFFLLAALLALHDRRQEWAVLAAGAASAWLAVWPPALNVWWDDRYLLQSLVFLALALFPVVRRAEAGARDRGRGRG